MSRTLSLVSKLACVSVLTFVGLNCEVIPFVAPVEGGAREPTSLVLDALPEPITEDDTVTMRAVVLDQDGQPILDATPDWTTSDASVATLQDAIGTEATLVAKQPGTTTIAVVYESLSASTEIVVHNRPISILYVSGSGAQGVAGETLSDSLVLRAVDRRGDAVSGVAISYEVIVGGGSIAPSTALTDVNGYARSAWTLGTAGPQTAEASASENQARVKNLKDSVVVFTAEVAATLESLEVNPSSATLEEGDTLQLDADATASDGAHVADPEVTWESTDTTVATVSSSGLLRARYAGTAHAIATATSAGSTVSDTTELVVAEQAVMATALDVRPDTATVDTSGTRQFEAIALMSDGTEEMATVEWSATGGTISSDGLYTAGTTAGTYAAIAFHALGYADTAAVTVVAPGTTSPATVTDLQVDSVTADAVTLTWTQVDDGTGSPASYALRYGSPIIDWGSASATEASIPGTAVGEALAYTFTGLSSSTDYQFQLVAFRGTLDEDAVFGALSNTPDATTDQQQVATVTASPTSYTFTQVGETAQITATGYDSLGNVVENAQFTFTTSDSAIVSVDTMGVMTARALGTAFIAVSAVCCDASVVVETELSTATRFVSTTGSDANVGSESEPWRTIGYALTQLEPGHTLYVRGGEYEENIKDPRIQAGRPDARIRVAAYEGERPVLRGLLWLNRPSYWTIDGLNVTWSTANTATDHMVKMTDGVGWVYENAEIWGARSFAGMLVYGSVTGEPADWTIRGNCVHDVWTDPIHHVNGDHNLYINTGASAGAGLIERNILFNAPNGQNVKLGYGSSDPQPGHGAANVTVRYNTMHGALKNLMLTDESHHNIIERNIIQRSEEGYALRAYLLTGTDNVIRDNVLHEMTYLQHGDPGYELATDGGGNLLPHDPKFDSVGCSGFRPGDDTAKAYGRYAP